jgi:hypothetical protein
VKMGRPSSRESSSTLSPREPPQDDFALACDAPPLARRQRAHLRHRRGGRRRSRGRQRLALGQHGRAAPALAAHRPINSRKAIDLHHAGYPRSGLSWDKWVSREIGCSSHAGIV